MAHCKLIKNPKWVVFSNAKTGNVYTKISVKGLHSGEIRETKSLVASEKGIKAKNIKVCLG